MGVLERVRKRREPEKTVLYRVLAEHLETFLARVEEDTSRGGLPWFVVRELRAFLDCGILARGFSRVHCHDCGKDALVAHSCKKRGFCPSCGARRMADTAAHLVDRVLPDVPILNSGSGGEFEIDLSLNAFPAPGGGTVSVNPGETWNFQAWHRDTVGLGSNFSDGLTITYQ